MKTKKFTRVLKNQRGQGMLEYVLLLAIIVGLVVAFKPQLTKIINGATTSLSSQATQVFDSNGGG